MAEELKPICIISQHPEIQDRWVKENELKKFLTKKKDDLLKEVKDNHKIFWKDIEALLDQKGLTQNASKMSLTIQNDVIYERERSSDELDGILSLLKGLLT